jgi:hypothetical protein
VNRGRIKMQVTRNELINDLGKAHKDQNDIDEVQ